MTTKITQLTDMPQAEKNFSSLLETTQNTRELGSCKTLEGNHATYNTLLRSDEIIAPSEQDIAFLQSRGITRIIDMRSKKECAVSPSPFPAMEQFRYYHIPIEEGSRIPTSPADVPHSYMRIAEAKNMPEVFRHIAMANTAVSDIAPSNAAAANTDISISDRKTGGTVFHCRAGKDRTGVVSAILLLSAGVSHQDIIADYMLTKIYNKKRFQKAKKQHPPIDIHILLPQEEYITGFLTMFLAKYGSAKQYFQAMGIQNFPTIRPAHTWDVDPLFAAIPHNQQ